jgi:hypothetical protein
VRVLIAWLASVLSLAAASDRANAGTLTITYEITGGSFIAPPGGSVTGGRYTIRLPADGPASPLSGPAVLESFSMLGTDHTVYYGNALDSHFTIVMTTSVSGNGTVGSGFRNGGLAVLSGPMHVHCSGPNCATAGLPASETQIIPLRATAFGSGISLHPGGGRASGTYQLLGSSGSFSISFTGREIDRTFVPEVGARGLSLVAALVVLVASRRRRTLRHPA